MKSEGRLRSAPATVHPQPSEDSTASGSCRAGVTPLQLVALRQLAESLATDVGRLRRVRDGCLVDRLARHAWMLDGFVEPTAAAIYRENGGNVERALADVDDRARQFGRLLGEKVER